jgi:hypothetical protein
MSKPVSAMGRPQEYSILKSRMIKPKRQALEQQWYSVGLGAGKMDQLALMKDVRLLENNQATQGLGIAVEMIKFAQACPLFNVPQIDSVETVADGPLTPAARGEVLGATVDLFNTPVNAATGWSVVKSNFSARPGASQVNYLCLGVGFHVDTDPVEFTALINAITKTTALTGLNPPVSPDTYATYDLLTRPDGVAGANTLGLHEGQDMRPGSLEWGWWSALGLWLFLRSYNWKWVMGRHSLIMDDELRYRAYQLQNAQDHTAGRMDVDITNFIRRTNDYYDSIGSTLNAQKIDAIRLGPALAASFPAGLVGTNVAGSLYQTTREFELISAIIGGAGVASMLRNAIKGNPEIYPLKIPLLFKAGVDYGLKCQVNDDSDQGPLAQAYLSADQVGPLVNNVIPALVTDDSLTSIGATAGVQTGSDAATVVRLEPTVFGAAALVSSPFFNERIPMKGGQWGLKQFTVGLELTDDVAASLADPRVRQYIEEACGCACAPF